MAPTFGLALRYHDLLPAEEAGIDRPRPRAKHGQSCAKHRQQNASPWIAWIPERNSQLGDGDDGSCYWGPQTKEKKHSTAASDDSQAKQGKWAHLPYVSGCRMKENGSCYKPLKEKAYPRPTVGEGGEQALQ